MWDAEACQRYGVVGPAGKELGIPVQIPTCCAQHVWVLRYVWLRWLACMRKLERICGTMTVI
jgi:hypothetical protein